MRKIELVYKEILFQALEKKQRTLTQRALASRLGIALSTVHYALQGLRKMNAIQVNPQNFVIKNPKKILYYWACMRQLDKDIIYQTRVDKPVRTIEQSMPQDIAYGAYSAYKLRFKDAPADYSEVYAYADNLTEIKKRFPAKKGIPNLFILQNNKQRYSRTGTLAQIYVDIWNIKEWYAKDFLKALEVRINAMLE